MNEQVDAKITIGFEIADSGPDSLSDQIGDQVSKGVSKARSRILSEFVQSGGDSGDTGQFANKLAQPFMDLIEIAHYQIGLMGDSFEDMGGEFKALFKDPAVDGFLKEFSKLLKDDPAFVKAFETLNWKGMGEAGLKSLTGMVGGKIGSDIQASDLFKDISSYLPFGDLLTGLPIGSLVGAGLGAATQKMFGKKHDPVRVHVENAAEIAERLGAAASVTGVDPFQRAIGRSGMVSERFAVEQAFGAQKDSAEAWLAGQVKYNADLAYKDPNATAQQIADAQAQLQILYGLQAGLDTLFEEAYAEQVDRIRTLYDGLGQATGVAGSELAAQIETVLQGIAASEQIASGELKKGDGGYEAALEKSKAAANAYKDLEKTLGDVVDRLESLNGAWKDFHLGIEGTVAELLGHRQLFLSSEVDRLNDEMDGLSGEALIAKAGELKNALMAQRDTLESGITGWGDVVQDLIRRDMEGWSGVVNGTYTEIEGQIPRAQRLFGEFMDSFSGWLDGIKAVDSQLGDLANARQGTQDRLWFQRFSINNALEELTTGEQLPFLLDQYNQRTAMGAGFDERQGLLSDLQEAIFSAYNSTEIGRPEALGQLDMVEGLFGSLYDEQQSVLQAERDRLTSMVDGSGWMQEHGLSFDDFASMDELSRAVEMAHQQDISQLRANEAERLWSSQQATKEAVDSLNAQLAVRLAELNGAVGTAVGRSVEQLAEARDLLQSILDELKNGGAGAENVLVRMVLDGRPIGEAVARLSGAGTLYVEDGKIRIN